ncbi:MAG: tetratricopeptide repeat protein [Burkholderiaceae bacterium]
MTIFFLIAAVLTATVLFLVAKLWTDRNDRIAAAADAEWQVLLEKRDEIESDAMLDAATRQTLREEWIKTADEVLSRQGRATPVAAPSSSSRKNAYILATLTVLAALTVYMFTGRLQADALAWNWQSNAVQIGDGREPPPPEGAKHPGDTLSLDDRIANLENRLKQAPEDLDGWVLLARSHGIQQDFPAAAQAIEQALKLAPGHPDLMADLADYLAMSANRSLAGRPTELIKQVLQTEPTHPKGLSLAVTAAMQRNDLAAASSHLRTLRAALPPESPEIAQIDGMLAEFSSASARNGQRQPELVRQPAPAAAGAGAITGSVKLSPTLLAKLKQKKLPEQATLFIVARNPEGPPMPVAVARLAAQDLARGQSVAFTLDDSSAMSPSMKLSALRSVRLEARISMSGSAGRQAGDMSGSLDRVDVGSSAQLLVIDTIVR